MDLQKHDLFLLDFDGLLVDTEPLHFKAYKNVAASFGDTLSWDLSHYCAVAQVSSPHLRATIESECPNLAKIGWEKVYEAKKSAYLDLLQSAKLKMMPGAEKFLAFLSLNNLNHCVVTHSPKEQIDAIIAHLPNLNQIPHWFTREDYENPKPAPDGYLTALQKLHATRPLGFEDSIRGLQSLLSANIPAVLIRPPYYPPVPQNTSAHCITTFDELF